MTIKLGSIVASQNHTICDFEVLICVRLLGCLISTENKAVYADNYTA